MEDVLEVYTRPPRKERPLVCLDEFAKQLLSDSRDTIPARPGHAAKQDYEYVREGSASGFMIALPHLGKRDVFVGADARRTAVDFAACLDHIANVMLPDAEKIVLVMDNLNTHNTASLYETFAPEKARGLCERFEIHPHDPWRIRPGERVYPAGDFKLESAVAVFTVIPWQRRLRRSWRGSGIRAGSALPAEWIRRHSLESGVVLEERGDELVLRPVKAPGKLSWAETAREIAAAGEDWSDWDTSMADGLGTVPWTRAAGKRPAAMKPIAKPRRKP